MVLNAVKQKKSNHLSSLEYQKVACQIRTNVLEISSLRQE